MNKSDMVHALIEVTLWWRMEKEGTETNRINVNNCNHHEKQKKQSNVVG